MFQDPSMAGGAAPDTKSGGFLSGLNRKYGQWQPPRPPVGAGMFPGGAQGPRPPVGPGMFPGGAQGSRPPVGTGMFPPNPDVAPRQPQPSQRPDLTPGYNPGAGPLQSATFNPGVYRPPGAPGQEAGGGGAQEPMDVSPIFGVTRAPQPPMQPMGAPGQTPGGSPQERLMAVFRSNPQLLQSLMAMLSGGRGF